MATAPALDLETPTPSAVAGTDIVAAVTANPGLALIDRAKFDAFYDRMKAETDKLVPNTATAKGRDEIRSLAARVVRSKTAINDARLALTKQWRDQTKLANDAGKEIDERMAGLAEEVRRPLTEWEIAEKARIAECNEVIAGFRVAKIITEDDTAATVAERGTAVWNTVLAPERFGELLVDAQAVKDDAVGTLTRALARLRKEEADRAELEKLRAADEERRTREKAEQEARDAAERETAAAAKVEEQRVAYCRSVIDHIRACGNGVIGGQSTPCDVLLHELRGIVLDRETFGDMLADAETARDEAIERVKSVQAEVEKLRIERERQEAAEAAQRETQRKADEAQAEKDREHEAALQAERDRAAEIERAAEAERQRIARGREMLAYIREVVAGRIGGQPYAFGVLLRELETKVVADDSYGDMQAEIEQARVDGLASLNAAMERQAERARQEEERAAAQAAADKQAADDRNKALQRRRLAEAKAALIALNVGLTDDGAMKVIRAIGKGEIAHLAWVR